MFIEARRCLLFFLPLLFAATAVAQQQSSPPPSGTGRVLLDVVVTPKSGPPVSGLQQQDFTVLDNKAPQPIASFQAIDGRQAQIEVILLVDAVNTAYQNVAYERGEIGKFLRADGGHLSHPTTIAILTDSGIQVQGDFSGDGNALSASLDKSDIGLRDLRRSSGFYGAGDRFQISLNGLHELLEREAPRPGRKIILWVSPGWPILSGPNIILGAKEQQRLFGDIVNLSTLMGRGRVTLYSVDPLGANDAGGFRTFYWKDFLKGVSKPSQVQVGNLALEVLAVQSGGLALNSSNDIAGLLQKCVSDTAPYYEISYEPPLSDQRGAYHHIEIRMANSKLTARSLQGYYLQP